jgi:four helix bundle protein
MSYRELEIFRDSKKLAIDVHRMTLELPKFEMYEEGGQVRRSSKAVASNILEGYCRRRYKAEYIRFLVYAQAECDETLLHLEFIDETMSATDNDGTIAKMREAYDVLSKRINRYIKWVDSSFRPER